MLPVQVEGNITGSLPIGIECRKIKILIISNKERGGCNG